MRNCHVLYQVNNLLQYKYSFDHVILIMYSISDLHYIKNSSQEIICFTIEKFVYVIVASTEILHFSEKTLKHEILRILSQGTLQHFVTVLKKSK